MQMASKQESEDQFDRKPERLKALLAALLTFAVMIGILWLPFIATLLKSFVSQMVPQTALPTEIIGNLSTDPDTARIQASAISKYVSGVTATVVYAVLTISTSLAVYVARMNQVSEQYLQRSLISARQQKEEAIQAHKNATSEAVRYRGQIDRIKNHIDQGNRYQEKVRIAVFSKLLAYAPLYVAQRLQFFEDEGLEVEVISAGGDNEVVEGIRDHKFNFGICDPVFVLEDKKKSTERLQILIPITKRIDITVACKPSVLDEKKGRSVSIACYSQPSTTYAAAIRLKSDLLKLGKSDHFSEVSIVPVEPDSNYFKSPTDLAELLDSHDFVLLWNPATSWLFQKDVPGSSDYGRLVCRSTPSSSAERDHWSVVGFEDVIDTDQFYAWHPNNAQETGYRLLASGLLVSEYMQAHRPELCKKVFRAFSRALVRLEGAKWDLEKDSPYQLHEMIKKSVDRGEYLREGTLQRLISDAEATRPSIFPFIQGYTAYNRGHYAEHLKNLRSLWANDTQKNAELVACESEEDYVKYFADLKGS